MSFQFQGSDVLARLKPFGLVFEKSLSDLIKGIRSHSRESPESLGSFLDDAIGECKTELSATDMETKAMAVLKLAYLEMYGFDMAWCNFHILEVMASTNFQCKRVGYLAAIQSFKAEQDLLILATNQFKKDLNSHNHIEIGLALSGIATIVTPHLSKDINDDVLTKLTHSKPYIRKKAILAMYKIFIQYPESLRINFKRIIDMLDDSDISVVSATINVICEISKNNPKLFINYLPKFFKILEETKNNWLTIRILKLFQSLSKVEPRMKRKILPFIMDLMITTEAASLIYECVNCVVNGSMLVSNSAKDQDVARLCVEQLLMFFQAGDQNLKYVGLLALINIIKMFPTLITMEGVSKIIMDCVADKDLLIKQKSLEICHYLITEDKVKDLIIILLQQLVPHDDVVIPDSLKLQIVLKIISIGSMNNYGNIDSFEWYIAALTDCIRLTLLPDNKSLSLLAEVNKAISLELGKEFKTLTVRIPALRSTIVDIIVSKALDIEVLEMCPYLLKDFYWVLGEYIDDLKVESASANANAQSDDESDQEEIADTDTMKLLTMGKKIEILNVVCNLKVDDKLKVTSALNFKIPPKLIGLEQSEILVVLIPCLIKVFNSLCQDYLFLYGDKGQMGRDKVVELAYILSKLIDFLSKWENHSDYQVQERALSWLEFLKLCFDSMVESHEIKELEESELEYYSNKAIDSDNNDDPNNDTPETQLPVLKMSQELKTVPLLISHVLPTILKAYSLEPISRNAQKNVPVADFLDEPINEVNLGLELELIDDESDGSEETQEPLEVETNPVYSDQDRISRQERIKYDPYYISDPQPPKKVKKLIDLDEWKPKEQKDKIKKKLKKEKVLILGQDDENENATGNFQITKKKKHILKIDSSNLDGFDLNHTVDTENDGQYKLDLEEMRSKLQNQAIPKESATEPKPIIKKSKKKSKAKIT